MTHNLENTGTEMTPGAWGASGTTEIYQVSSQFQILSLIAAIHSGTISNEESHRVLLLCNNASIPENAQSLVECDVTRYASQYFSQIVDFNDFMYPLKPIDFGPQPQDCAWLTPMLRQAFGVPDGHQVTLYLESIQAQLSRSVARVFWDSPIIVHADGLMVFGPTRERISTDISQRIVALSYPDFLPQVKPLLLSEYNVTAVPTSASSFSESVASFVAWRNLHQSAQTQDRPDTGSEASGVSRPRSEYSLVLGQYLSALGIFTPEQDFDLSVAMVQRAATFTPENVVFKPHPSASRSSNRRLIEFFANSGITVRIDESVFPVEVAYCSDPPVHVVSCFSTGLVTAHNVYGIPVSAVGTEEVLERLTPYENSNRIPATICDVLFGVTDPQETRKFQDYPLPQLLEGVTYCMQSTMHEWLLPSAEKLFEYSEDGTPQWRRYVKKRRAEALGLVQSKDPAQSRKQALSPVTKSSSKPNLFRRAYAKFIKRLWDRPKSATMSYPTPKTTPTSTHNQPNQEKQANQPDQENLGAEASSDATKVSS